jgi:rubrerythrin
LVSALSSEKQEHGDMYATMAETASAEGFEDIADWFATISKAERSHAQRFQKALDEFKD